MKLSDYEKSVKRMAESAVDYDFSNKGYEHAGIVLTHLIKNAITSYKMYSGSLCSEVLDQNNTVTKSIIDAANRGVDIQILLEHPPKTMSDVSGALKKVMEMSESCKNIEVKCASSEFIDALSTRFLSDNLHFSVADSKAFRLEIDSEDFKAACNFNAPHLAKHLEFCFDHYFPDCEKYKLPQR